MLSENVPAPTYNGPVLTVAQIIKNIMYSAAEYELAVLFICAKAMVPLRQSLTEMGRPQPKSPIQCDNSTAVGVSNATIIPRKMKSIILSENVPAPTYNGPVLTVAQIIKNIMYSAAEYELAVPCL